MEKDVIGCETLINKDGLLEKIKELK